MTRSAEERLGAEDAILKYITTYAAQGSPDGPRKLPTEREFSAQFAMPRSAVRRALLRLERRGLVIRQVGRGTFINPADLKETRHIPDEQLRDVSPMQLIAARIALEPAIAFEAAKHAVSADFRAIATAVDASVRARTLKQYETADEQFHLAVAVATGNTILLGSMKMIIDARLSASWGRLKETGRVLDPKRRAKVRLEHLAILDAVMSRDGQLAKRRMMDHLLSVESWLFDSSNRAIDTN